MHDGTYFVVVPCEGHVIKARGQVIMRSSGFFVFVYVYVYFVAEIVLKLGLGPLLEVDSKEK